LYHTFGDGTNCGDDFCADTPPTLTPTFGCPAFPTTNSCSPVSPGAMTPNFMDYTDDSCMYLFTHDQAVRMHTVLQFGTFRQNLGNANYCNWTPTGSPLQAAVYPTAACPNFSVALNGFAPYQADSVWWETPLGVPIRTSGNTANVNYATAGPYIATFKAKYPNSATPKSKAVNITVNAANCAGQTPFAYFSIGANDTCAATKILFKNNSASAANFLWTFASGIPSTSNAKNPLVTYNVPGKYKVLLQAFSGPIPNPPVGGAVFEDSVDIKVCKPDAIIDSATALASKTFCSYDLITFKNKSKAYTTVSWLFPKGYPDNSTLESPTVSYAKPGSYTVKLIAQSPLGTDTTIININVVFCNSSCGYEDTIANFKTSIKTAVLKNPNGWGYIGGHNSDKDIAIGEKYKDYPYTVREVRGAIVYFSKKYDGNDPSNYKIGIRGADAFGYPDGSANGIVAQANISMLEISTGPGYKGIEVSFNPKGYLTPGKEFFVTLENLNYSLPGALFGSQDTIAVYSTADNPNTTGTAYKLWSSDGQWHAVSEPIAENKNISFALYPIVCGVVGLDEIYNKTDNIVIYPNPANDILYLGFNSNKMLKYAYKMFDNSGKVIKQQNEFRTRGTIPVEISDLSPGFYHIQISNNGKLEHYRFTKQ
jgi:PKD repeat protein